jgi:hypothetical protein
LNIAALLPRPCRELCIRRFAAQVCMAPAKPTLRSDTPGSPRTLATETVIAERQSLALSNVPGLPWA